MAQEMIPRLLVLRRRLSPFTRLLLIAAVVLTVGLAVLFWPAIQKNDANQSQNTQAARADAPPGTFRPTKEQWAGFKIEPVRLESFRPEQVTEGNTAIDDDLTTPVFSPYSGRVTKLIAKLGDNVEPGAPLFAIQASEFVQAQNDLITALANLQTAGSQLAQTQINEKRAHDLYLAQGGALKDWQQAQTDLVTAQNTVRGDEIPLAAVPQRAIVYGGDTARVRVAGDDGTIAARSVRTGQIADGMVEILAGLSPARRS